MHQIWGKHCPKCSPDMSNCPNLVSLTDFEGIDAEEMFSVLIVKSQMLLRSMYIC